MGRKVLGEGKVGFKKVRFDREGRGIFFWGGGGREKKNELVS